MKSKILIAFTLLCTGKALAQTTSFTITYEEVPACYTEFTVMDSSKRVLGSGKSDGTGTFSCNCDVNTELPFILKAKPDKGKGWELKIPPGAVEGAADSYDIKIEQVEALMNEAFDEQNKLLGGSKEKNDDMNEKLGSSEGENELGAIGGIVSFGQKAGKAQFTLIKSSIGKSCLGGESKSKDYDKTKSDDKKSKEKSSAKEDGDGDDSVGDAKSKEEKKDKKETEKEKKELEKEKQELEKEKEKMRKEKEEIEKEKAKEKEKEEKKKKEEEEEDEAPFKIYTNEELDNMSSFDLKRTKLSNNQSMAKRKTKLKVKSAFYSEDKKKQLNDEIDVLNKQVEYIKGVLVKRNEKPDEPAPAEGDGK